MRRDLTYIDDIIQGVKKSLFVENLDSFEVLNIGNHRSKDLLDMIRILADNLGIKPQMDLLPMQPGDVAATYADIDRARDKLEFQPKTPMADGIARFVEWFKAHEELVRQVNHQSSNGGTASKTPTSETLPGGSQLIHV
jgi:UDP-glucuronate 4-epimerase